jgi:hypothetical protein
VDTGRSRPILNVVRLIALLLTVMMMTGTAAQVCASPDVAGAIDDAPDLVMPAVPEPVEVARPAHRPVVQIEAPPEPGLGRMHAVLIFRPPR